MSFGDNLQNILTKGFDAAVAIKTAKLQVNDPTINTSGPGGVGSKIGQAAYGIGNAVSGLTPLLLLAGLAVAAVVIIRLVKR